MKRKNLSIKNCYFVTPDKSRRQRIYGTEPGAMFQTNADGTKILSVNFERYIFMPKELYAEYKTRDTHLDMWVKGVDNERL